MDTIEQAMQALRAVESNGRYDYQQKVKVGKNVESKIGAYGILESRWRQMAEAEGYAGASWKDPMAQDRIAAAKLQRDYDELESWELAAVSFRFGMRLARAMKERGYGEPKAIEDAGYKRVGQYMRDLRSNQYDPKRPVEGQVPMRNTPAPATAQPPQRKRTDDIVRAHLRAMQKAQRGQLQKPDMTAEPDMTKEVPQ